MAVPVPVHIAIAPPPVGWSAQEPNRFQALVQLIASLLSGQIEVSFLSGQIGGAAPTQDVGPWQNGNEWWFWNPTFGSYQPSEQGCPVGTVAIWGTRSNVPARWIFCNGQALPISSYPRLYNAIGLTWGGQGGNFRLPPGAVMFLNAPNFNPAGAYDDSKSSDGAIYITGGAQTNILGSNNLPACHIKIPYASNQINSGTGNNLPQAKQPSPPGYSYPITDESGHPVGTNQQPFSTMPPFVSVHYIIKYL